MSVLMVRGLCKSYPGFELKDISFSLEEGRITGFIGRNGAGKTTSLKSLLNLIHPDSGTIEFFGRALEGNEAWIKERIGFVSGGFEFYPGKSLKVISDIYRRFYPSWDEGAYHGYMAEFALDEGKTPKALSAGMKVKYALALALSHNARLLILDEPTSGLDPVSRDELLEIFLSLRERGASIFFSTHITSDLDKCAEDIVYIRRGRIEAQGGLGELLAGYRVLRLEAEYPLASTAPQLIGLRRDKSGYTALVRLGDAPAAEAMGQLGGAPDLEAFMVHMEKGD